VIYSFPIWRDELKKMRSELLISWEILECLNELEIPNEGSKATSARFKLQFNAQNQFMKGFFLSAFAMRKIDEAASHPWPAGMTLSRKHDRQIDKRLSDFSFDTPVGEEETLANGKKVLSPVESKSTSGRKITNLAIHSVALRFFDQPFDEAGFWIQSDIKPYKKDRAKFLFIELSLYSEMLDNFIRDPQE